jgi:hypothetical protein
MQDRKKEARVQQLWNIMTKVMITEERIKAMA